MKLMNYMTVGELRKLLDGEKDSAQVRIMCADGSFYFLMTDHRVCDYGNIIQFFAGPRIDPVMPLRCGWSVYEEFAQSQFNKATEQAQAAVQVVNTTRLDVYRNSETGEVKIFEEGRFASLDGWWTHIGKLTAQQ